MANKFCGQEYAATVAAADAATTVVWFDRHRATWMANNVGSGPIMLKEWEWFFSKPLAEKTEKDNDRPDDDDSKAVAIHTCATQKKGLKAGMLATRA